ncbi:MAG: hypothetical protein JXQ90_07740 [Cyclobacteriaceae bacterium]
MKLGKFDPPIQAPNVPNKAKWLGGQGAGSWFYIDAVEGLIFNITRFSPDGIIECQRNFELTESGFDINASYKLTYLSHCLEVRVLQNNQMHIFKAI